MIPGADQARGGARTPRPVHSLWLHVFPNLFRPVLVFWHAQRARRRCAHVGARVTITGRVWVHGAGVVEIGDDVQLRAESAPIELFAHRGARLVIGAGSVIEGGASLEATSSVVLGPRTVLGAFTRVMDNHFHPLLGDRHSRPMPRPVAIGADSQFGPRCIVLAGADLPAGSRFGAGSVIRTRRGGSEAPNARAGG